MKKLILFILLPITIAFLSPVTLLAEKKKDVNVAVLSETYFVVVQGRGPDDSSVLLYRVYGEKLQLLDALVVNGDFADVNRPTVRVLRPTQYTPKN